eukprot:1149821-Pelagomonas_calceolata.AAC.1
MSPATPLPWWPLADTWYVTRYSDPVMATGWHMVMGGVLLLGLALQQNPQAITQVVQGLGPQVRGSGCRCMETCLSWHSGAAGPIHRTLSL